MGYGGGFGAWLCLGVCFVLPCLLVSHPSLCLWAIFICESFAFALLGLWVLVGYVCACCVSRWARLGGNGLVARSKWCHACTGSVLVWFWLDCCVFGLVDF
jgi:hypothetical protein